MNATWSLVLVSLASSVRASESEDCHTFVLKRDGESVRIEAAAIAQGSTRVFPANQATGTLGVLFPFGNGLSGDLISRRDSRLFIAQCLEGELRIRIRQPDGRERAWPSGKVAALAQTDMRVNVVWQGGHRVFLLSGDGAVSIDSTGPLVDIIGSQVPLDSASYAITTEVTRRLDGPPPRGAAPMTVAMGADGAPAHAMVYARNSSGAEGWMVVDLGADRTVIAKSFLPPDANVVRSTGTEYSGNGSRVLDGTLGGAGGTLAHGFLGATRLASLHLGNVVISDLRVDVLDSLAPTDGRAIVGILGLDVLRRSARVRLTFGTRGPQAAAIDFDPPELRADARVLELPLAVAAGHLFVAGRSGSVSWHALLDTGSPWSFMAESLARSVLPDAKFDSVSTITGLDNHRIVVRATILPLIALGSSTHRNVPFRIATLPIFANMGLRGETVLLGNSFFARFQSMTVDFAGHRLILEQPDVSELRIDPLSLVSVAEARRFAAVVGDKLFPGWRFDSLPVLVYRPGVQEVLLNYPGRPPGYSPYVGFNPVPGVSVMARDDSTTFDIDAQNTTTVVAGVPVLVIADGYSRLRSNVRQMLLASRQDPLRVVSSWGFLESPYREVGILLHEGFHIYQHRSAPKKIQNDGVLATYPLLDPVNNTLFAIEGAALCDALRATDTTEARRKARQFVAVRATRRARLDSQFTSYEDAAEFLEGLGRYIELRYLQLAEQLTPSNAMFYHSGFDGYRGVTPRLLRERIDEIETFARGTDAITSNPFSSGPLRERLYGFGAAQGLLLDRFSPDWKARVFVDGVWLSGLLGEVLPVSASERPVLAGEAERDYSYPALLAAKQRLERDGRANALDRVAAILDGPGTLVTVSYAARDARFSIGFSPFGITQVDSLSTLYDMVPIDIRFAPGVTLVMKEVLPVLIDRRQRTVSFALPESTSVRELAGVVEAREFRLTAPGARVQRNGRKVRIDLPSKS